MGDNIISFANSPQRQRQKKRDDRRAAEKIFDVATSDAPREEKQGAIASLLKRHLDAARIARGKAPIHHVEGESK